MIVLSEMSTRIPMMESVPVNRPGVVYNLSSLVCSMFEEIKLCIIT